MPGSGGSSEKDGEENHEIEARPTKEFFIDMLTKDIELVPAIVDLVDNSIDGARRHKQDRAWDGLRVTVTVKPGYFEIADNCGGIEAELARKVAFRFGRPSDATGIPGSIGVFGVGMKRALFKLAREFRVNSVAPNSMFSLHLNVEDWKGKSVWNFDFDTSDETKRHPFSETYTKIVVSDPLDSAKQDFQRSSFWEDLLREIREKESQAIENGLEIRVETPDGGHRIEVEPKRLLRSAEITPAFVRRRVGENGGAVDLSLYVGIERLGTGTDPAAAGWYVYCNDRLIVGADKSSATGWGEDEWGEDIPAYHNQFAWFRGYAFFESSDPSRLPWNTAKTELDQSSVVMREAKEEMAGLMRPVIDFLNAVDSEKPFLGPDGSPTAGTPLTALVLRAKSVELPSLRRREEFFPSKLPKKHPRQQPNNVGYFRPQKDIDILKQVFNVASNRAVGEKSFDYTLKRERPR